MKKCGVGFILVLLLLTTVGCFREPGDTGLANITANPGEDKIITQDAYTNNLMNSGSIVNYGDATLFTLRNSDNAVYKIDDRGKTLKVLDEIQASQLLVCGRHLFVIDSEPKADSPFGLYRLEPGEFKPHLIYQSDRQMFGVFGDEEWVYYCVYNMMVCEADEPPPGEEPRTYSYYTLYKIKSEGGEIQEVINYIYDLNLPYISDGWIYYSSNLPDWAAEQEKLTGMEKGLYKIKLDGTGKTKLLDDIPFSPLVKQGDWLFYASDGIYRLSIDGSEKVKIGQDSVAKVNVKDQWVFYTSFDDNISLHKVDWEGHNRQKMSQLERVQDISILGDWIYFHVDEGAIWSLNRIKVDGTEAEKVEIES